MQMIEYLKQKKNPKEINIKNYIQATTKIKILFLNLLGIRRA
jgi:hypothetical protein